MKEIAHNYKKIYQNMKIITKKVKKIFQITNIGLSIQESRIGGEEGMSLIDVSLILAILSIILGIARIIIERRKR